MEGFEVNDKIIFYPCGEYHDDKCKICKQKINKTIQKVLRSNNLLYFWFCCLGSDETKFAQRINYGRI